MFLFSLKNIAIGQENRGYKNCFAVKGVSNGTPTFNVEVFYDLVGIWMENEKKKIYETKYEFLRFTSRTITKFEIL